MATKKENAIILLEEVLENLENPKYSIFSAIQKLNRIGKLLNEKNLIIWTEIQLGNSNYTIPLEKWIESYLENSKKKDKVSQENLDKATDVLNKLNVELVSMVSNEELTAKATASGGGFENIGFIEEKYNDFVKTKRGNDGTYYKGSLMTTLSTIKSLAYKKASLYHSKYAYEALPESNFEVLKKKTEDVLFEIDPEIAELLLLAFKSVSSDNQEEWSQALTSCRRFFEKLADNLYPATDLKLNDRSLTQENYINRLWAYMDRNIESKSNKDIAKKHVDLLGAYLQGLYRMTNKGVHSDLNRFEAIKTVMHIYLLCADLLEYLDKDKFRNKKPNIYNATLDELEVIGNVNRNIAKEIIKLRVVNKQITSELLLKIPGFGKKTLDMFLNNISIEKE
ncbi:MAG TPA: helix-hairpin-helix domain-containing protein [Clostridia bacterium]|nr:helix-hairpin-helix domain-containing protein [Clostridia bacterium]